MELLSYTSPLHFSSLPGALADPQRYETSTLGIDADLDQFRQTVEFLTVTGKSSGEERASWDRNLSVDLHQCLKELSNRQATDMGLWHWLCVSEFPGLVWLRWTGSVPEVSGAISPALSVRFLGSPTLNGISRNTLARLYWCAVTLYSEQDQYELVQLAFSRQDLFQAIFDRRFGLYPPAARACVRVLHHATEERWREATRRLNHVLTTTVLEALDEDDVTAILMGS